MYNEKSRSNRSASEDSYIGGDFALKASELLESLKILFAC